MMLQWCTLDMYGVNKASGVHCFPNTALGQLEPVNNHLHDVSPFRHRSESYSWKQITVSAAWLRRNRVVLTDVPAREHLPNGTHNGVSDHVTDDLEMLLGERVLVHQGVHRREDVGRGRRGQRAEKGGLQR